MPHWQLKHRNGELYPSLITYMLLNDAQSLPHLGWERSFDWTIYLDKKVLSDAYKLIIVGNSYIQGAIAYHVRKDHLYVDLLESAPENRWRTLNGIF